MAAGNRASQVPARLLAPPAADHLSTANLTEFAPNDLLLVADRQQKADGGPADCLVSQASGSLTTGAGTLLALGGTGDDYYGANVGTAAITNFTDAAVAFDLGAASNSGGGQAPVFQLLGVGNHDTLYSYDLLQIGGGGTVQAEAEGVFEMHAVYGVDSTGNASNQVDQWVGAGPTSAYSVAALTDGSAGAMGLLKNIRAVRVALILRTSLPEKDIVAPSELALFADLSGVARTRALTDAERHFRYRVVETTIPVRNNAF
jgi:type IV pilus assembly protein PilW